jgi:hypothetical protein
MPRCDEQATRTLTAAGGLSTRWYDSLEMPRDGRRERESEQVRGGQRAKQIRADPSAGRGLGEKLRHFIKFPEIRIQDLDVKSTQALPLTLWLPIASFSRAHQSRRWTESSAAARVWHLSPYTLASVASSASPAADESYPSFPDRDTPWQLMRLRGKEGFQLCRI